MYNELQSEYIVSLRRPMFDFGSYLKVRFTALPLDNKECCGDLTIRILVVSQGERTLPKLTPALLGRQMAA